MNNFKYQYPVRQHLGKGCAENAIKEEMKRVGKRVLLAYGGGSLKRTGLYDKIKTWLEDSGKEVTDFGGIMPNPTYAKVQEGARIVRGKGIDFILAVGGGSVIDCCKIVSSQAKMEADAWDDWYINHNLPKEFVPMGAVVTASGTGAEKNNECHMIEHAVGAYTDCNHGQGLAILHPTFYRHLLDAGTAKLARMAQEVWGVKSDVEGVTYKNADATELRAIAAKGIDALENFIKEIGLPTRWSEICITDDAVLRAATDICFLLPGCCKQMSRDEIYELLEECKR